MKKFLGVLVVLAIAVVVVGFWRGWFSFTTSKEEDQTHLDLIVNKDKFKKDKEKFKEQAAAKSKAMKEKLDELRAKSKGLSGDEKVKADKEIDELSKKHEGLESDLKKLEDAGEDKFEALKKSISGAIEDHKPSTAK